MFLPRSVEIAQASEKFPVLRLFTNGINAGGNHPHGHSPRGAGHQHINDHFVMRCLLAGKRKKADQQLRIQKIPLVIGKAQPLGQRPRPTGLLQRLPVKPPGRLVQNIRCDAPGVDPLSRLGKQAGAQIVQGSQIVKQNAVGTVRPFDLDADLRADQFGQFPVGIRGPVQAERPSQPALSAQEAVPQPYRCTVRPA